MNPRIYRWVICFACTLALFCTGGLLVTGFNVYTPYLISEGGLTNAQVSIVMMVRNLFTLISMFIVVPLIRRVDIRLDITLAVLLASIALLTFSNARHFIMFCAAMGISGMAYGLGGMVSISVIVKRWFAEHEGLALGICAAGTGLSAVIGAPIITAMIEQHSMQFSLRREAAFMVLVAAIVLVLLRNYPSREKQEEVRRERRAKSLENGRHEIFHMDKGQKNLLMAGVLLCGMSYNASPFLTVLLREKGFDASTVGWMASIMGFALCVGKCVYGEAVDFFGRVRAGNLFHGCFVLAIVLCALCIPGSQMMAYTAMVLLGIGFPMLSVGLSELAAGTAHEEYYADAIKQFQIVYMIGSLLFGPVPGVVADATGSYARTYCLLAAIALAAAILQQTILKKNEKA